MAAERKVPLCQGNRALSRPMRVEAPAARMTPANEGERGIDQILLLRSSGLIYRPYRIVWRIEAIALLVFQYLCGFLAFHVGKWSFRPPPQGYELGRNRDCNLFRRDRANINPHRGIDARQLLCHDA